MSLTTTGFDSFTYGNPSIDPSLSGYVINPLSDGRNILFLNTAGPTIALVPGASSNVLLGTLRGPSNTVATVALENCDLECGGTVFLVGANEPFPNFSLSVIPEPEPAAFLLGAASLALALRTARRRVA